MLNIEQESNIRELNISPPLTQLKAGGRGEGGVTVSEWVACTLRADFLYIIEYMPHPPISVYHFLYLVYCVVLVV